MSARRQAPKYKKFGGCLQTEFEIKKIEKIEKPLPPQKEKEQRDREPPPQVEVTDQNIKEKEAEEEAKSKLVKEADVKITPTVPKKRRKRTLF